MKTRTITLTAARPVKINEADWPVIAQAVDHDGEHVHQSNRRWTIKVREHTDGRSLVYGVFTSSYRGERDRRAGYLLPEGGDIPASVRAVVEGIEASRWLVSEVLSELPPVEL